MTREQKMKRYHSKESLSLDLINDRTCFLKIVHYCPFNVSSACCRVVVKSYQLLVLEGKSKSLMSSSGPVLRFCPTGIL